MTLHIEYSHISVFDYEGDVAIWDYANGPIPQGADIEPLVTHRII